MMYDVKAEAPRRWHAVTETVLVPPLFLYLLFLRKELALTLVRHHLFFGFVESASIRKKKYQQE